LKHLLLALTVSILLLSCGGTASAGIIYTQNFNGGTAPGFSLSGLWHVTSNFPFSPNFALGYVQGETSNSGTADGNYDTGNANSATAFSPAITLPSSGPITLTFQAFNHNEYGDSPDFYDRLSVGLSTDGTTFGTMLASTSFFDSPPVTIPYWTPSNQGYNLITVDLTPFAGQTIYLAFNYNTEDGVDNGHPGARIDDIQITGPVPEPTTLTLFGVAALTAGYVGLRRRKVAEA
jgi:hypothetical protein